MKIKEIIQMWRKSHTSKAFGSAILSFSANIFFALFNLVIGVIYRLLWNFTISFYYILLTVAKAILLLSEKKNYTRSVEEASAKRETLFKLLNYFLIFLDVTLVAPVILMIFLQKSSNLTMIPTIALAAYTTYKISSAIVHFVKRKRLNNLSLEGFRAIRLKEGIVSIITLQNTMVFVFGDPTEMLALTTTTSILLLLLSIGVSIFQFICMKKERF